MSERFYYEIVAAPDAAHHASAIEKLIRSRPALSVVAESWGKPLRPSQSDLYALLVVASDGLAADSDAKEKIAHASAGGFPVIPVVENVATYDFRRAPLAVLAERNAESLADGERLLRTLLHHGGIELFEGGGHVFISYARADGADLANAVRDGLTAAGIGRTMDVHAFAGGELIQDEIERRIRAADLVVLIDSMGAAKSSWVAEELDMALAAHVQVVAVTPAGSFHHALQVPHVAWRPGPDAPAEVVGVARRLLARKLAFRARVGRILGRLARLRSWDVTEDVDRWRVRSGRGKPLTVGYLADTPRVEAVVALRASVEPERGLLVAGVRPLQPATARGLRAVGGKIVAVTPLPSMASKIPARLAARPLSQRRVFLSAAMPDLPDDVELAQATLAPFVLLLTQSLLELGAVLVFGGHPSVTPVVHRAIKDVLGEGCGSVELHQARYWQKDVTTLPAEVREGPLFRNVVWHGTGLEPAADVSAMRDGMLGPGLTAGVFVGGKTKTFIGPKPGIIDEHERFRRANPGKPSFVMGLAGGAAREVAVEASQVSDVLMGTADPDLAVALIVAELIATHPR